MSTTTEAVLADLIPLGLVVALSPVSIIPAVLVLHTARPRVSGLAFLAGWLLSIVVMTEIFVGLSVVVGRVEHTPTWAWWVRIVLGAALIVYGLYHWTTRNRSSESPAWMRQITEAGPLKAFGTALFLAVVNPKVLLISAAAGVAIGTAGWGWVADFGATTFYAAIGSSSIILPVVAYLAAGERLAAPLGKVKDWMQKHNVTLVAAVLILIGVNTLVKGIQGLI